MVSIQKYKEPAVHGQDGGEGERFYLLLSKVLKLKRRGMDLQIKKEKFQRIGLHFQSHFKKPSQFNAPSLCIKELLAFMETYTH